ncbi:unnamed protein product [Lepeophtheirus salmonis]|uniref:(salmon louse) hypothetical protein n=1 Tax=Lepeophtheirus salmonis TaxID=72036 RepID=A0A7R8CQ67_LEPSM|nr:unnamed protein product [Lepeophtheirus salmonis]CAF2892377.1 unnamed protein product [Lepeophtheirus salmonis]
MSEDPDYTKSPVVQDEEKVRTLERNAEAKRREKELELIDERILQVRKSLQLIRYGAVVQFYDPLLPKRTRSDPNTKFAAPCCTPPLDRKGTCVKEEPSASKNHAVPNLSPKDALSSENVSKWIRCDERGQDNSTHKWMIYIRGDKENPRHIQTLLKKSVFSFMGREQVCCVKNVLPSTYPPSISMPKTFPQVNGSNGHLTDLEKRFQVSLWKRGSAFLGRGFGNETQSEIENRVAKRGIHLLKKQTEFLSFLNEKPATWQNLFPWLRMLLLILYIDPSIPMPHPLYPNIRRGMLEKRMASEWLRAKTIYRIIHICDWSNFSVPDISLKVNNISDTSNSVNFEDKERTSCSRVLLTNGDMDEIDVISLDDSDVPSTKKMKLKEDSIPLSFSSSTNLQNKLDKKSIVFPDDKSDMFKYVGESVSSLGINLVSEEIDKDIHYPMSQKLIYKACQSFCELLLRQSFKVANERTLNPLTVAPNKVIITLNDVCEAVQTESSLKILSNAGLGISIDNANQK